MVPFLYEILLEEQEKNRILWKCRVFGTKLAGLVVYVALTLILLQISQWAMQYASFVRMNMVAVMLVLCGILYLLGRRRFTPHYV